ncbi:hypothetical protein ACLOJK_025475 [Asimina triloba]
MNSLSFPQTHLLPSNAAPKLHLFPLPTFQSLRPPLHPLPLSFLTSQIRPSPPSSIAQSSQTPTSGIPIEEIVERDWSFLEPTTADPELAAKTSRIISAANIKPNSRILVSLPTQGFIDRLVESPPAEVQLLLVVHESLFLLAGIKEKYDEGVRCWQGGIRELPRKWAPLDAVFLCYLPGLGSPLDSILRAMAARCSDEDLLSMSSRWNSDDDLYTGGSLIISFAEGREAIKRHQQQYPDMVTANLPDKPALEAAAMAHSFKLKEFVDEPTFYLAVLKFCKGGNSSD